MMTTEQTVNSTNVEEYKIRRPLCTEFVNTLKRILNDILSNNPLKIHSVEGRVKTVEGFIEKASRPSDNNPDKLKYDNPLDQINDQSGIRIIVFLPSDVDKINEIIKKQFNVIEKISHGTSSLQENRFGYQSTHFVVKINNQRLSLLEYQKFRNLKAEIQVRTILQHAWAEIEHDITYKSAIVMPTEIRRRLAALAGMLEIADKEFQRIQEADKLQRSKTKQDIKKGMLENVEITSDALRVFLDKHLGTDARMSNFSYDWATRLLRKLGFVNFNQVNECINEYDDNRLSQISYGTRQGQISRFVYMLLAGMGNNFVIKDPWQEKWFVDQRNTQLEKFRNAGIKIGSYSPDSA